MFQQQPKIT